MLDKDSFLSNKYQNWGNYHLSNSKTLYKFAKFNIVYYDNLFLLGLGIFYI